LGLLRSASDECNPLSGRAVVELESSLVELGSAYIEDFDQDGTLAAYDDERICARRDPDSLVRREVFSRLEAEPATNRPKAFEPIFL